MQYEEIKNVEDPSDQEPKRVVLKAFHGEKACSAIRGADERENGRVLLQIHIIKMDQSDHSRSCTRVHELQACAFAPRRPVIRWYLRFPPVPISHKGEYDH